MIQNDAAILQHFIENWEKELPNYLSKIEDQIISRKALPVRKVGADVMYDVVVSYERTGEGAQIMAKGAVPKGSGVEATSEAHTIYQLLDGFLIHEKDLKLDPKLKSRDVEIILRNIHRAENILSLQGNTLHNIPGISTGIPGGNQHNVKGKWDGSATARQMYNDVLKGIISMDPDFDARWLIGNRVDMLNLFSLSDDTKQPIYKQIAALFGKSENDPFNSWAIMCGNLTLPAGKVYIAPHDPMAAELVVSENPAMRSIAQQRGGNYPIEMFEWLTIEKHELDAFAQLNVDTE